MELEIPKTPDVVVIASPSSNLPKSSCITSGVAKNLSELDLSDVFGDFEATLKHSSKPYGSGDRNEKTLNGECEIFWTFFLHGSVFRIFFDD